MATTHYTNNKSDSDSFDMFTDSDGSDDEWKRASVDVRTLPPDTTTTGPITKEIHIMKPPPMFMHSQFHPAPNTATRAIQSAAIAKQKQHPKPHTKPHKKRGKKSKKKGSKGSRSSKTSDDSLGSQPSQPHPKRTKTIMELITTEATYVANLQKLIKLYARKLENNKKMMATKDYQIIFNPLLTIATLHDNLLKCMQTRYTTYQDDHQWVIWDIIMSFVPNLTVYETYFNQLDLKLRTIRQCLDNPKLYTFHQKQKKHFHNSTLTDLILHPVHRFKRYKVLIQGIVDQTNSKHPDSVGLKQTLGVISDILRQNNEVLHDLSVRVAILNITNEIQRAPDLAYSTRRFVFSQTLYTIKLNGKTAKYIFYLFTDCLLYCAVSKHGTKCVFKMRLPIDAAFSVEDVDDMKKYKNVFAIYSSLESFMVTTKADGELKTQWMQILNKVKTDARNSNYFHSDGDKARMGRGSVFIRQAPLQVPKSIQKQWNKLNKTLPSTPKMHPVNGKTHTFKKRHERSSTEQTAVVQPNFNAFRSVTQTWSLQKPNKPKRPPLPSKKPSQPRLQLQGIKGRPMPDIPRSKPHLPSRNRPSFPAGRPPPLSTALAPFKPVNSVRRRSSYGSAREMQPHASPAYLRANTTQPMRRRSSYGSTRDMQCMSMSSHKVQMPPRVPHNTKLIESNTELATDDKIERVQQTISIEDIRRGSRDKKPLILIAKRKDTRDQMIEEVEQTAYTLERIASTLEKDIQMDEVTTQRPQQSASVSTQRMLPPLPVDVVMKQRQQQSASVSSFKSKQLKQRAVPLTEDVIVKSKSLPPTMPRETNVITVSCFEDVLEIVKQAVSGIFEEDTIGNCVFDVLEEGFEDEQEVLDDLEDFDQCTIIPDTCCGIMELKETIQYEWNEANDSQIMYQILQKIFAQNVHDITALINEFAPQTGPEPPVIPCSLLECMTEDVMNVALIVTEQINKSAKKPIDIDALKQFITEEQFNGEALTQMDAKQFLAAIKKYRIKAGKGRQLFNGILHYWPQTANGKQTPQQPTKKTNTVTNTPRTHMVEHTQPTSGSMIRQTKRIAKPQKNSPRAQMTDHTPQQSGSIPIYIAHPQKKANTMVNSSHTQQQTKQEPMTQPKKPPINPIQMMKQMQRSSASVHKMPSAQTKDPTAIMKVMQQQSVSMKMIPQKKGFGDLVSRFSKEEDETTSNNYSTQDADPDLIKMRSNATAKQNLIKDKNYDNFKNDLDTQTVWNAYINQHGEEPKNEWTLHAFIKAQPQLPSKTFRQARGMFRALKGSGYV